MKAGQTVSPFGSTTRASGGAATEAPTAWMSPLRTTMVPRSIVAGPFAEAVTIRAFGIAYALGVARSAPGRPSWAERGAARPTPTRARSQAWAAGFVARTNVAGGVLLVPFGS